MISLLPPGFDFGDRFFFFFFYSQLENVRFISIDCLLVWTHHLIVLRRVFYLFISVGMDLNLLICSFILYDFLYSENEMEATKDKII